MIDHKLARDGPSVLTSNKLTWLQLPVSWLLAGECLQLPVSWLLVGECLDIDVSEKSACY